MVHGEVIVKRGQHQTLDHRKIVERSDQVQEILLDETNARQYLRKRSRFNWID